MYKLPIGVYQDFSFPDLKLGKTSYSSSLDVVNIIRQRLSKHSLSIDIVLSLKLRIRRIKYLYVLQTYRLNDCEFRMFELKTVLSQTHDTCPGPGGITHNMVCNLYETSLSNQLFLFNRVCTMQSFSHQWQEAILICILKPNKNPTNSLLYRPIVLSNVLYKTLEHVLNARLSLNWRRLYVSHRWKSEFQRERSTFEKFINLATQLRNAFVSFHCLVSTFFDVEKTNDSTWRYGIL